MLQNISGEAVTVTDSVSAKCLKPTGDVNKLNRIHELLKRRLVAVIV